MEKQLQVTLCTFHCGTPASLVVLRDWLTFLGSPCLYARIATVTDRNDNFTTEHLEGVWPYCDLLPVSQGGLGLNALDAAAIFEVVESAKSEWILLVKLDTLPYCSLPEPGFLNWLIGDVEAAGLWGATGSFIPHDLSRDGAGRAVTTRYSNNYSLFRRDAWLDVIMRRRPDFVDQIRTRQLTPSSRFVTEATIEEYLLDSGDRMLFLEDTLNRSVFHVNQWGQELLDIRERYLRREGIERFLNLYDESRLEPWKYPAWERYYGWPRPHPLRRFRIWAGRTRRQM